MILYNKIISLPCYKWTENIRRKYVDKDIKLVEFNLYSSLHSDIGIRSLSLSINLVDKYDQWACINRCGVLFGTNVIKVRN